MTINGLGQFDMMSAYNRIERITKASESNVVNKQAEVNANSDVNVNTNEIKPVEEKNSNESSGSSLKLNLNLDGIRARSNASLEDISRDFKKRDNFVINSLDSESMENEMKKAITAMEQDSSLKQYQYFVGDKNVVVDDEDGIVFMK